MGTSVDYEYYQDFFCGTALSKEAFPAFARKADAYVQYLTGGKSRDSPLDAVKDAICAICDVYAAEEARVQAEGDVREIASENNDGWAASYVTEGQAGQTREETLRQKAYQAAYPYLAFTGLLKRRVPGAYQCRHHHL